MGRPRILETTTICPDCGGNKYRYAKYCNKCKGKGERNPHFGIPHSPHTRTLLSEKASRPKLERRGNKHPLWKGDDVKNKKQAGEMRARSAYRELLPCAKCGITKTERHHIDGNQMNNDETNVIFLCRPHHRQLHPGHGKEPLRPLSYLGIDDTSVRNLERAANAASMPSLAAYLNGAQHEEMQ